MLCAAASQAALGAVQGRQASRTHRHIALAHPVPALEEVGDLPRSNLDLAELFERVLEFRGDEESRERDVLAWGDAGVSAATLRPHSACSELLTW